MKSRRVAARPRLSSPLQASLRVAERFFLEMAGVPRVGAKVEALALRHRFAKALGRLRKRCAVLQACRGGISCSLTSGLDVANDPLRVHQLTHAGPRLPPNTRFTA